MILLLRQRGYDVTAVADVAAASALEETDFSLLCLDLMTPGLDAAQPLEPIRSGEIGAHLLHVPVLLTDVNGIIEGGQIEVASAGADGLFTPRTGRGFPFLVEVERLVPPPPQLPGPVHTWRLDKNELPAFLYACFLFSVHGVLTLRDGRIFKQIHFSDGWMRTASSSLESEWLGKLLLARHQVSPEALNEVERALSTSEHKIGEEFVARGYLTDEELIEALNQQYASIVMSVFEWDWAEVSLDDGHPNPGPQLGSHPFKMLLAGLNFGFTEEEIDELLGGVDSYPTPTPWTAFRIVDVELNEHERHLLPLINGQRAISDLIAEATISSEATKKFLYALSTIRALVLTIKPHNLPATFESQIGGDHQAMIETAFFQESDRDLEMDFIDKPDFDDLDDVKDDWRTQLTMPDIKLGIRYILLVILALITFWIGLQILVEREVDSRIAAKKDEMVNKQIEMVLIKKPVYVEADRLLVEATLQLRDKGWEGIKGARYLIGGALSIDPRFEDARRMAHSIDLAEEAKVAFDNGRLDRAKLFYTEAIRLAPNNPLLVDLAKQAGLPNPEGTTAGKP